MTSRNRLTPAADSCTCANSAFDYQHGRLNPDDTLAYRPEATNVGPIVESALRDRATDPSHVAAVLEGWDGTPPNERPVPRLGSMACSSLLVDNERLVTELNFRDNNFVGIDMESHGIARASEMMRKPWLVIKGVQDYGDGNKGEDEKKYRRFAAYASARYAVSILPAVLDRLAAAR